MRYSLCLMTLALCACAGVSIDEQPNDDEQPSDGAFNVPLVPVDAVVLNDWVRLGDDLPTGVDVQTEGWLPLALGVGYPTDLTLVHGEIWQSRCLWEGEWQAKDVASADPGVVTARMQSGDVALQVVGAGTTQVTLTGTFTGGCPWPDHPGGRQEVQRVIEVIIAEPDGAELIRPWGCESPLTVAGAPLEGGFDVVPTLDGKTFAVRNALPGRQVSVMLDLPAGVTAKLPAEDEVFGAIRFDGAAGLVEMFAPTGAFADFEVASPADVTSMDLGWGVPQGNFGYTLHLEHGETYAWSEMYEADGRQVVVTTGPTLVSGRAACSGPSPSWFDVTVDPKGDDIDGEWVQGGRGEWIVGRGAYLAGNGTVSMTVAAPDLNGGRGLRAEIAVTFTE